MMLLLVPRGFAQEILPYRISHVSFRTFVWTCSYRIAEPSSAVISSVRINYGVTARIHSLRDICHMDLLLGVPNLNCEAFVLEHARNTFFLFVSFPLSMC